MLFRTTVPSSISVASLTPAPPIVSGQNPIHPFCRLYYQCQSLGPFERKLLYLQYCFSEDQEAADEEKKKETVETLDTQFLSSLDKLNNIDDLALKDYLEHPSKQYSHFIRDLIRLLEEEGFAEIQKQTEEINAQLTLINTELAAVKQFYTQFKKGVKYGQLLDENLELAAIFILSEELRKTLFSTESLARYLSDSQSRKLETYLKEKNLGYESLIRLFDSILLKSEPLITKIRLSSANLLSSLIKKALISIARQRVYTLPSTTLKSVISLNANSVSQISSPASLPKASVVSVSAKAGLVSSHSEKKFQPLPTAASTAATTTKPAASKSSQKNTRAALSFIKTTNSSKSKTVTLSSSTSNLHTHSKAMPPRNKH